MKHNYIQMIVTGMARMGAILVTLLSMGACASDNVHQPQPDLTPAPQTFQGSITSTVPAFPFFDAVTTADKATVTWNDESMSSATILLGAFSLDVEEMSMHIDIGDMTITSVTAFKQNDGSYELTQPEFECQAGAYHTTGCLEGILDGDTLTLTLLYMPGSMPFEVQSVFSGTVSD